MTWGIWQWGSPNVSSRRGWQPTMIVMHITAGSAAGALTWMRNEGSKVSAHFLIEKTGKVHQVVDLRKAAWHAGRVSDPTCRYLIEGINPNCYTIGIEHEGTVDMEPDDFPEEQILASRNLVEHLRGIYGYMPLVRHREINGDKECPGNLPIERIG